MSDKEPRRPSVNWLRVGALTSTFGLLALALGTRNFIGGISVFGKIGGWSTLLPRWPLALLTVGGLALVVGIGLLITSIVVAQSTESSLRGPIGAVVALVLIAPIILFGSVGAGQAALQRRTAWEASQLMEQVSSGQTSVAPGAVDWAVSKLRAFGVDVPDQQETMDALTGGGQ